MGTLAEHKVEMNYMEQPGEVRIRGFTVGPSEGNLRRERIAILRSPQPTRQFSPDCVAVGTPARVRWSPERLGPWKEL